MNKKRSSIQDGTSRYKPKKSYLALFGHRHPSSRLGSHRQPSMQPARPITALIIEALVTIPHLAIAGILTGLSLILLGRWLDDEKNENYFLNRAAASALVLFSVLVSLAVLEYAAIPHTSWMGIIGFWNLFMGYLVVGSILLPFVLAGRWLDRSVEKPILIRIIVALGVFVFPIVAAIVILGRIMVPLIS